MLKIYISYNCSSCKKAMKWLEKHGIAYESFNIFTKQLTEDEVLEMLKFSENGFQDIISTRSNVYEHFKSELEDKTVKEYVKFIIQNAAILKRPIMVDDITESIIVGYNEYDMDVLL